MSDPGGKVGPVLPPYDVEPGPNLMPVFPPVPFLISWPCPLCGIALANGTPIGLSEEGLAHASCGGAA